MQNDIIKKIPAGLERYLGTGNMILPSESTLRNELESLPQDRLITLPRLRTRIAEKFDVATACPKTTLSTLRKMIDQPSSGAYRVVNGKGELIAKDMELQAGLLRNDTFDIDDSKAKYKVQNFKHFLVDA